MNTLNDFIRLMTKVFDFLPRYLDLSEKSIRTEEEEIELDELINKIENLKKEIIKLIPELNTKMYEDIFESYYELKIKSRKSNSFQKKNIDYSSVFQVSLKDWLNISLN